jgi:hypothetical protein
LAADDRSRVPLPESRVWLRRRRSGRRSWQIRSGAIVRWKRRSSGSEPSERSRRSGRERSRPSGGRKRRESCEKRKHEWQRMRSGSDEWTRSDGIGRGKRELPRRGRPNNSRK